MAFNLNKILFKGSSANAGVSLPDEVIPFYEFDLSSSQKELTAKLCSPVNKQTFCLYLALKETSVHPESLNQLILCLTDPNYHKENSKHLLLLSDKEQIGTAAISYCNVHGFLFCEITEEEKDTENFWWITQAFNKEWLTKEYENKIVSSHFINKWIILAENITEEDLIQTIGLLKSVEKDLNKQFPVLETLALSNRELKQQNNLLNEQNAYLKRELEHYKTFNKQLKEQDESETILRFYHREYELLPLWYKRLGHIIKVLMGKRKFSSLYKKNRL